VITRPAGQAGDPAEYEHRAPRPGRPPQSSRRVPWRVIMCMDGTHGEEMPWTGGRAPAAATERARRMSTSSTGAADPAHLVPLLPRPSALARTGHTALPGQGPDAWSSSWRLCWGRAGDLETQQTHQPLTGPPPAGRIMIYEWRVCDGAAPAFRGPRGPCEESPAPARSGGGPRPFLGQLGGTFILLGC
jgi:hypothetical protein